MVGSYGDSLLNVQQFPWPHPFSAVVLGDLFSHHIRWQESPAFLSVTRIELMRWDVLCAL